MTGQRLVPQIRKLMVVVPTASVLILYWEMKAISPPNVLLVCVGFRRPFVKVV